MTARCPLCQAAFELDPAAPHRPFCSPRCKKQDLLHWLEGKYRLPRELLPEDLEALPEPERSEALAALTGQASDPTLH